MPFSLR